MIRLSKSIEIIANQNNIEIDILSTNYKNIIKNDINNKYLLNNISDFLWENLNDSFSIQCEDGWKKVCDFIKSNECLMFFNHYEDDNIIKFNNGYDLYKLLYEMFAFEFYITNFKTEYLICFNHHSCLICSGSAKKWLYLLK